jgi:hypothetical protein
MNAFKPCAREEDVLDALASNRWPSRSDEELRRHVERCASCSDLLLVARALLDAADDEADASPNRAASLVWWRSQLRAREEGARAAVRPLRVVELTALAAAAILVVVVLAATRSALADDIGLPGISLPTIALPSVDVQSAGDAMLKGLAHPGVQLAAGAWLVIATVVAYILFAHD